MVIISRNLVRWQALSSTQIAPLFQQENERINETKFEPRYEIQINSKRKVHERVHFEIALLSDQHLTSGIEYLIGKRNYVTFFLSTGKKEKPEYGQHLRQQKLAARIYLPFPLTCS